ncbi:MAG: trypsin-like peptidase domain-containing protein [Rickettsiaceae bacterium]|nr:trypsin-like peptidase domain-containing protein [Rickettsiaceae bacterium]
MLKLKVFLSNIILLASINSASASPLMSFADILEPLIPTVVNVYTITYNNPENTQGLSFTDALPIDQVSTFFKKYNIPIAFDNINTSPNAMSLGSGFIVDEDGYIITNNHVVAGSDEIYIKLSSGKEFSAKIVGTDPNTDLALLKIETNEKLPVVKFANSSKSRIGDIVIAIGNPLGFGGTVTTGIISSKGRDLGDNKDELVDDFIQTDAAINTGNSGGPLFNINGEVIGLNTAIADVGNSANIGIGFAIPSETVLDILKQLKEKGEIHRGRLDISVQEMSEELFQAMNVQQNHGVLVVDVRPDGVGDKAGLKRGDLISEFNGEKVLNSRKLELFVADTHIGTKVNLSVLRDNQMINLTAEILEIEHPQEEIVIDEKTTLQKSDIIFSNLTPQLVSKFGIHEKQKGIIVVEQLTSNLNLDLKVGDLIMAINHQHIEEFNNIYEQIKSNEKQNTVLLVKRKSFSMFAVLPIK